MNINPTPASIVAGTARAAAKGGEADKQASEAASQQSVNGKPGGKASDTDAVDAGSEADDRGGSGHEAYDVFESSESETPPESAPPDDQPIPIPSADGHLDFEA